METYFSEALKSVSELIQLSIAPVFMLAGIAGFLGVFTNRLARIIDRLEKISLHRANAGEKLSDKKLNYLNRREKTLKKRMKNINKAILFMTMTGLFVSFVMIAMFLSVLLEFEHPLLIAVFFIASMTTLIIALLHFLGEIIYTVSAAEVSEDYKVD